MDKIHHAAKLTPDDVRLIRALRDERERLKRELEKISQKEVAKKFGVSPSTISEAENMVWHWRVK